MFARFSRPRGMVRQHHTFLFADLAGFTCFTERHGDDAAAELSLALARTAARLAAEHGGRLVKCLGDAVMLRVDDAGDAVRLGLRLHEELESVHPLHSGVHTGCAVEHGGDWYGAAVNLASRVACAAGEGELLVTEAAASSAGALPDVDLESRGEREFKNVTRRTPLFAARRGQATSCIAA
jgi:adenylate cyclase